MTKYLLVFSLCLAVAFTGHAQKTINGILLPATLKKDSLNLTLNGGGVRKKVFFKLYVAGLYLKSKTENPYEIIQSDKEMAMRLTITSRLISSENMSEAIEEGFKKSTNGNTTTLLSKIDMFISAFKKEEIKGGDLFEIWYLPNVGVQVSKNGKLQNTITGMDFKKALFGIWFSSNPVDEDLKNGLLGQ